MSETESPRRAQRRDLDEDALVPARVGEARPDVAAAHAVDPERLLGVEGVGRVVHLDHELEAEPLTAIGGYWRRVVKHVAPVVTVRVDTHVHPLGVEGPAPLR